MAIVTVTGANGQVSSLSYDSTLNTFIAQQVANTINAGVAGGTVIPANSTGGTPPALGAGQVGEYVVQADPAVVFVPVGYDDVVINGASGAVNLNGDANQNVLVGATSTTINASAGAGTIVGGSGNDLVTAAGGWVVTLDNGNDTVSLTGTGAHQLQLGTGNSQVTTGGGTNVVSSTGNTTITVGAGATTIEASLGGTASVQGGAGTLYFVGGTGNSTIVGGTGTETVFGGKGNSFFQGGSAGNNRLYSGLGNTTLLGAGSGDQLYSQGSGSKSLIAGVGSETLAGAASTDLFTFTSGNAGTDLVKSFTQGADKVHLAGFSPADQSAALAGQMIVAGSDTLSLSDGTKVTFLNLATKLTSSDLA